MFRKLATAGLAALTLGTTVFAATSLVGSGSAQAYDRHERQYERRAYGWRPAPPAFHGYWGQRRWQRWNEERRDYGYGYGRRYWR
ncbi:hypothetical protein [Bosea sp. (in: a-proteobacteria)]|uniref:hypothetical protein n=1 Tax=Bosea sp. (in: a-proteobacteria) TaxID=1871050 RepID=UPI002FCB0CF9